MDYILSGVRVAPPGPRLHQVLLYGSLYHDARSGFFHTHHNVVVGGPMWLYLQWGAMGHGR